MWHLIIAVIIVVGGHQKPGVRVTMEFPTQYTCQAAIEYGINTEVIEKWWDYNHTGKRRAHHVTTDCEPPQETNLPLCDVIRCWGQSGRVKET